MEETATNLGIEMKHIDTTKLRKKDKGDSDANDGSDSDGKSVKTKKKKHKRSGSFFRRSQENLTKID